MRSAAPGMIHVLEVADERKPGISIGTSGNVVPTTA